LTTNNIKIKRVKIILEKSENTKEVIRCSKSKKDRQHNDQKKTDKKSRPWGNLPHSITCFGNDM